MESPIKPAYKVLVDFERAIKLVGDRWATKTLAKLKAEALQEANGTAFESIRTGEGKRLMIAMCLTGQEQISMVEKLISLDDAEAPCDWDALTLIEFVADAQSNGGLGYQDVLDSAGKRTTLALCASTPDAVKALESIFRF